MSRSVAEIIFDLTKFNPHSNNKLSHDCYMILIGFLQSDTHLQTLKNMISAQGDQYGEENTHAVASIKIMECEEVETILENITLKYNTDELIDARKQYFVYEDNFNTAVCDYMEDYGSYEKLKRICCEHAGVDHVIKEHAHRANKEVKLVVVMQVLLLDVLMA